MDDNTGNDDQSKQIRETFERLGHEQAVAFLELLKTHTKFLGNMDGHEVLISAFALGELCGMLEKVTQERLLLINMPPDMMKEAMDRAYQRGSSSVTFKATKVGDKYRGTNPLN